MKIGAKYALALTAALLVAGATGAAQAVTLTMLVDNNSDTTAITKALTDAYTKQHPDVKFDIEPRATGAEGDNIVKTRLATGEMADIFGYNSGSLLQALKPDRTLVPLNDLPNAANLLESFKSTVSGASGNLYGIPDQPAMAGGILYNIPLYKKLGLSIPKSWDEFIANNEKIKAETDVTPIIQTYRDTWTSQLFVLADFYNVLAEVPDFADRYTAHKATYAETPAALQGFEYLKQTHDAGYFNADFGAATYNDGLRMVALGEGAHYPMLTFAIPAIQQNTPEHLKDVGFFPMPGPSADKNGLTVWMPNSYYIPKSSSHIEEAKEFVNFVATPEACDLITGAVGATGPYMVKGCKLPADIAPSVADMLPYFQQDGLTAPALEFLSPVKGPSLEQLTVEVGSGMREPKDAAALYDRDVEKQARQLGLPNW